MISVREKKKQKGKKLDAKKWNNLTKAHIFFDIFIIGPGHWSYLMRMRKDLLSKCDGIEDGISKRTEFR